MVGIVGYKFRSTNVHGFIFGSRNLEIEALPVPCLVRMFKSLLLRAGGTLENLCFGANGINVLLEHPID